jgi:hypothetical protein
MIELSSNPFAAEMVARVLIARAFSKLITEHVDKYVQPVFDCFRSTFEVNAHLSFETGLTSIESPRDMWLAEPTQQVELYFDAVDKCHCNQGYLVFPRQSPAFFAQSHRIEMEKQLIAYCFLLMNVANDIEQCRNIIPGLPQTTLGSVLNHALKMTPDQQVRQRLMSISVKDVKNLTTTDEHAEKLNQMVKAELQCFSFRARQHLVYSR